MHTQREHVSPHQSLSYKEEEVENRKAWLEVTFVCEGKHLTNKQFETYYVSIIGCLDATTTTTVPKVGWCVLSQSSVRQREEDADS